MRRHQFMAQVVVFLVIGGCVLAVPALAQDCPELVGHLVELPGPITAVAVSGDYVYLGTSTELLVANVSDPSAPQLVGEVTLPGYAHDVAVSGAYAYVVVSTYPGGLYVIDVSTPSAPAYAGFVDIEGWSVAVVGEYAYVSAGDGLHVIDVSTPPAPVEVGFVATPRCFGMAVSEGYAYVTHGSGGGLRVIDVSTPTEPVEVGFVDTSRASYDVVVSGGYAYVAGGGLQVIDVSTPSMPVEVGFLATYGDAIAVSGGYAYVVDYSGGLRVIDVSTPSTPVEVGFVDTPGGAEGVAVSDGYVYLAALEAGLYVFRDCARVEDCPELVGRWPYGPAFAAEVSGGYLYSSSGSTLRIAELSDPSAPQVVGEIALPDAGIGIRVSGDYAYVADHSGGLRVVDVSVPSTPVEVGFVDTPGVFWGVAVSGDYAYVAAWDEGLRVIDVSTPSNPVEVGFVDTPGGAWGVVVSGEFAYVADDTGGLRVIDVSTPSAPVEVGVIDTPGSAGGVAVSGNHAYVADYDSLRVIDISTPSAPVEVGFVDTPVIAWAVAESGGFAFVADWDGAVRVIDVSTPSAPVEVGVIDTPGLTYWVAVAASYAYVADASGGLRVIDVGMPSAPVEVDVLDTPGWSQDVAVSGAFAYVADDGGTLDVGGGLHVLDLSTPSAPVEAGFVRTPDLAYGVAVSGSHAYVAAESAGLRVIDVSSPIDPVEVGFFDTSGAARGVAVSGRHAYVADANQGFRVIDVSTPSAPVEVGFVDTPGYAVGVAVSGGYAFVADTSSLRVIDVRTPSAPVEVGFMNPPGPEYDVAVSGRYAYLANGIMGLRIIDVSSPSAPVEVGYFDLPGALQASSVALSGGYAYVAEYYADETGGSLRVIDVSTPSTPLEVGYSEIPYGDSVAVSEGRVVVGGLFAGVYVYVDCGGGPSPDGRECFIPAAAVAAGAQGAFFQTDVEINNTGTEEAEVHFQWLPRGEDNSAPTESDPIALAAGQSLRYENVLTELFNLEPDSLGALKMVATTESVIGMSRTYNSPEGETAGTFGQGLPAIRATEMIQGTAPQRIIFLSENEDSRANVGCVNGSSAPLRITIGVFDAEGSLLETETMDLGPYSNNQINRVFRDYQPVNGYVDVWADSDQALYSCYGSMLDNETSDPTTILPQVPSHDTTFIPAAALAAGLEGSFFQTDVDLNNVGSTDLTYRLAWLPRGADNSEAVHSDPFSLAPGAGVRYANVLDEVFGLEPDQVGALAVEASGIDLLAMSRTYNLPSAKVAGTFGQELPGIAADRMITTGERKRIIFMNENDDVRSNVGCQNGSDQTVRVFIELFNADGESLETKIMDLAPWSNNQITRVFRSYSPVEAGYVDVWTTTPGATIYCYGSVLDNLTSDPTTVLPQ